MRRRRTTPSPYFLPEEKDRLGVAVLRLHELMVEHFHFLPELTIEQMQELISGVTLIKHSSYTTTYELAWPRYHARIKLILHGFVEEVEGELKLNLNVNPLLFNVIDEKINSIIAFRKDFGRLKKVVDVLVEHYTKREIRYLFPPINVLCEQSTIESIPFSTPRRTIALSYSLRKAVEHASETVASTVLFKDQRIALSSARVYIPLHYYEEFNEDGFTFQSLY